MADEIVQNKVYADFIAAVDGGKYRCVEGWANHFVAVEKSCYKPGKWSRNFIRCLSNWQLSHLRIENSCISGAAQSWPNSRRIIRHRAVLVLFKQKIPVFRWTIAVSYCITVNEISRINVGPVKVCLQAYWKNSIYPGDFQEPQVPWDNLLKQKKTYAATKMVLPYSSN